MIYDPRHPDHARLPNERNWPLLDATVVAFGSVIGGMTTLAALGALTYAAVRLLRR